VNKFLFALLVIVLSLGAPTLTSVPAHADEPETLIYYFPMVFHSSALEEVVVEPSLSYWRMYSRAATLDAARAGSSEVGIYPRWNSDVWSVSTLPPYPGVRSEYVLWRVQGSFDLSHLPADRRIHRAWLEVVAAGEYQGTTFELYESPYLEPTTAAWAEATFLGSATRDPADVNQYGVPNPFQMPLPGLAGRYPSGVLGVQLRSAEAPSDQIQVGGLLAFGPTTYSGGSTTTYSRLHILLEPPPMFPEVQP
jgi:hypothetical protein